MASQLAYKVYNGRELVATTVYAEDAAMVAGNTPGSTVKADGRIVWREGREEFIACDYIDRAAHVMMTRRAQHHTERYARLRQAG